MCIKEKENKNKKKICPSIRFPRFDEIPNLLRGNKEKKAEGKHCSFPLLPHGDYYA